MCAHGLLRGGAGALAQHSLVLLHLWSGTTGTVFLSRTDGYSGAVGPTRPQLEPNLLQAVFFLDQEAPKVRFCMLPMTTQALVFHQSF